MTTILPREGEYTPDPRDPNDPMYWLRDPSPRGYIRFGVEQAEGSYAPQWREGGLKRTLDVRRGHLVWIISCDAGRWKVKIERLHDETKRCPHERINALLKCLHPIGHDGPHIGVEKEVEFYVGPLTITKMVSWSYMAHPDYRQDIDF